MKIIIVSGFLGSGKTSFIKSLVENTVENFVILENEFGESNLDGKYLENSLKDTAEELKIWELTQGCICCSVNLDLTYSVLTIANTLNPDYLIIEPSGVAKLGKLLEKLKKIEYENIEIGIPITIIDTYNFLRNIEENYEYIRDYVQNSGLVVLSKSENLDREQFDEIKERLNLPLETKFPTTHYSKWNKDFWYDILNTKTLISKSEGLLFRLENKKNSEEIFEQCTFSNFSINNADELTLICTYLMSKRLGRIDRVKGNIKLNTHSLKVDLVGERFEITGSDDSETNEIVVIGKNLNKEGLKVLLNSR